MKKGDISVSNLYQRACTTIPGGVNSPSRSWKGIGEEDAPFFVSRAKGAYLWDQEGKKYIDYIAALGPIILGHGDPTITEAIRVAASHGTVYGAPTEREVLFAETLQKAIPSLEQVRLTCSGTEAVMSAIRLARAYTGRTKILKFSGCYHGHCDTVLLGAGSGVATTVGTVDNTGIPHSVSQDVITIPFNDPSALETTFSKYREQFAAILVEPLVGNFGIVPPNPGFLTKIQKWSQEAGTLVIYDEVITAFRFQYGAIQDHFGIRPDLTTLGKIIGGGLPIGAYGGRKEIMKNVAPLGSTYQGGTMAGNPISTAAGLACLQKLRTTNPYPKIEALAKRLWTGLQKQAESAGIPVTINAFGGAFTLYFHTESVHNYQQARESDGNRFSLFFRALSRAGIALAPSKYEAWFLMAAHTESDIEATLSATERIWNQL